MVLHKILGQSDCSSSPSPVGNVRSWPINERIHASTPGAATSDWSISQDLPRINMTLNNRHTDKAHGQPLFQQSTLPGTTIRQCKLDGHIEISSYASGESSNASDTQESSMSQTSHSTHSHLSSNILGHEPCVDSYQSQIAEGSSATDTRNLGRTNPELCATSQQATILTNETPFPSAQPTFPSLAANHTMPLRFYSQSHNKTEKFSHISVPPSHDDHNMPPNHFAAQVVDPTSSHPSGIPMGYTPPLRNFPVHVYPARHIAANPGHQLYDIVLTHPDYLSTSHPQPPHQVCSSAHQSAIAEPSVLRDMATLAVINNPTLTPALGIYPPRAIPPLAMNIYTSQFFGSQDIYPQSDAGAVSSMSAGPHGHFMSQYNVMPGPLGIDLAGSRLQNINGPSSNNRKLGLYKTELCRSWEEKGSCRYGSKCQFAHGDDELRKVARHPKYKTEICRTFWVSGACPYGKRCCFIHTELAVPGIAQAAESSSPSGVVNGRARSLSTNSDSNDTSSSLLARIQRKGDTTSTTHTNLPPSVEAKLPANHQFSSRPPTGSLRVDTSTLNGTIKQNKSAYPTFTSNGLLLRASELPLINSPVPLTAGPDLGRPGSARIDPGLGGRNQGFRLDFNTELTLPHARLQSYQNISPNDLQHSRHTRSGSTGSWASFKRAYPVLSDGVLSKSSWSSSHSAAGAPCPNEKSWS